MISSVAVIIPSLNSPIIDQVLGAVTAQDQIEAVDDILVIGKDDAGLVVETDRIRLIDTGHPMTASQARNRGIALTKADLLIFLDSDCLPQPGWLSEHITANRAGYQVVSGSVLPEGDNYWHLSYNLTLFHEFLSLHPAGTRDFLATLNLSVERSVIGKVGTLDESIERVEDVDWTTRMRRAGFQPYFWPQAAVRHQHNRTSLKAIWRDCASSGYHMRRLRLQHDDLLQAPGLLRYPRLLWLFSPFISAWATFNIIRQRPLMVLHYWYTLPTIYLTKIAWCWGASRAKKPT